MKFLKCKAYGVRFSDAYSGYENSEPVDGETNRTFKIPTGIENGISKMYYCIVSCDGYTKSPRLSSIAVGDVETAIDIKPSPYDWIVSVCGDGLTGDIVIADMALTAILRI